MRSVIWCILALEPLLNCHFCVKKRAGRHDYNCVVLFFIRICIIPADRFTINDSKRISRISTHLLKLIQGETSVLFVYQPRVI